MSTAPILCVPLKPMERVDIGAAIRSFVEDNARSGGSTPTPASLQAASNIQGVRDRLVSIDKLTYANAEAAAGEFMRYEKLLSTLEKRFDHFGSELGRNFSWMNAFKHKRKAAFTDVEWERVGVLYNAAAAYSYQASQAQPRGPAQGGLKEAALCFQYAAYCLESAHALVKGAIWGLQPRWPESQLTNDCKLESLDVMRDLMLAQAQRCAYEKGVSENVPNPLLKKLSMDAANLFQNVSHRLSANGELLKEIEGESGGFFGGGKGDKSFLGKIDSSKLWSEALAFEHAAIQAVHPADDTEYERYGDQVYYLRLAKERAEQAISVADQAGVPRNEMLLVQSGKDRLHRALQSAEQDNATIYHEEVPHSLAPPEAHRFVKPTAPEGLPDIASLKLGGDPFATILPSSIRSELDKYHSAVYNTITSLTQQNSQNSQSGVDLLRQLNLPGALDAAAKSDKVLPPQARAKIELAKRTCTQVALNDLRNECETLDNEAKSLVTMVKDVLKNEEVKDKELLNEVKSAQLSALRSTVALQTNRSTISAAEQKLGQAGTVTRQLGGRLDGALDELQYLSPSIDQIEAAIPNLDGTPLDREPCFQALRVLIDDLSQLTIDSAAQISAAQSMSEADKRDPDFGENLLTPPAGVTMDVVVNQRLAQYETVRRSLDELNARRMKLLDEVRTQNSLFVKAMGDATSFADRVTYFQKLTHGADEMVQLHSGLTEGRNFYRAILKTVRAAVEEATKIADQRVEERRKVIQAANFTPQPSSSYQPPRQPVAPPAYQPQPQAYQPPQAYAAPARAQPVVAQPVPTKIACYGCKRHFGVPPNSNIVACPFCKQHNRVPGR